MISHLIILLISFIFLIKGADFFIETCAKLAKKLGVSEFVIGLTVTAIGTSLPELASSLSAGAQGATGIVIGNVVGSNIANIGLIIGISAFMRKLKTEKKMYERDGYILILSVLILYFFARDNIITWNEGFLMLFLYVFYIMFLFKTKEKESKEYHFHDFMQYMFSFKYIATLKSLFIKKALDKNESKRTTTEKEFLGMFKEGLVKDFFILALSSIAIIFGAKFLINEAIWLANLMSVPESLIGITIIAIGTSLPELSVSIAAAKKGHGEIVIGNILGSNIANSLLIVGVTSFVSPIAISTSSLIYTIPIMGFFSLALTYFIKKNKTLSKKEGLLGLVAYVLFLLFALVSGF